MSKHFPILYNTHCMIIYKINITIKDIKIAINTNGSSGIETSLSNENFRHNFIHHFKSLNVMVQFPSLNYLT